MPPSDANSVRFVLLSVPCGQHFVSGHPRSVFIQSETKFGWLLRNGSEFSLPFLDFCTSFYCFTLIMHASCLYLLFLQALEICLLFRRPLAVLTLQRVLNSGDSSQTQFVFVYFQTNLLTSCR